MKLSYQKPNVKNEVQNGPIIKNEVLPVTALFFETFFFQFKNLL